MLVEKPLALPRCDKNPAYRRHQISWPMGIVAPILFFRWRWHFILAPSTFFLPLSSRVFFSPPFSFCFCRPAPKGGGMFRSIWKTSRFLELHARAWDAQGTLKNSPQGTYMYIYMDIVTTRPKQPGRPVQWKLSKFDINVGIHYYRFPSRKIQLNGNRDIHTVTQTDITAWTGQESHQVVRLPPSLVTS